MIPHMTANCVSGVSVFKIFHFSDNNDNSNNNNSLINMIFTSYYSTLTDIDALRSMIKWHIPLKLILSTPCDR